MTHYNKTITAVMAALMIGGALSFSASAAMESSSPDLPRAPEKVSVRRTATPGWIELRWEAVTEDVNGNALADASVTYTVAELNGTEWVNVAEGLTGTSYSYKAVEEGQRFVQCGVYAVTGNGRNIAQAEMLPLGIPYDGISESFADAQFHYSWGAEHIEYGYVDLFNDTSLRDMKSYDGDNGYMGIYGNDGCGMHFISGLVSLEGMENPALTFYTNNLMSGDDQDEVSVAVNIVDGAEESGFQTLCSGTIGTLCSGYSGWQKIIVPLAGCKGKTIQFRISGVTRQYLYKYFDDIKVASQPSTDLMAVSLAAPVLAMNDEVYSVRVVVRNNGTDSIGSYTVSLIADGEEVENMYFDTALSAGAQRTIVFERTMSPVATSPVVYKVRVHADGDSAPGNDMTEEVAVSPVKAPVPSPSALSGTNSDGGVSLTWKAPDLTGAADGPVTENFETGRPFSPTFGDWVFVDRDKSPAGGLDGISLPGFVSGETAGAFWVWDNSTVGADFTFNARSGSKYLFSLYRNDDGPADDWAISPLLNGKAQQISFYAASYNAWWLESIEVYYSAGSTDPADFIKIEGAGGMVPGPTGSSVSEFVQGWTEFTADLPEGARRFAIRSCAEGAMMLMLDDVTFIPADGYFSGLDLRGYNVYRDGKRINADVVGVTSYTDADAPSGKPCVYHVTAVYEGHGESAPSAPVSLLTSAVEQTVVSATDRTEYYNLQGVRIDGRLMPGIYVRRTGSVSEKIIVK